MTSGANGLDERYATAARLLDAADGLLITAGAGMGVDSGQFQKAGFADSRVCECHGSIHHLQCTQPCMASIWPATDVMPVIGHGRGVSLKMGVLEALRGIDAAVAEMG